MHEWQVTLTQPSSHDARSTVVRLFALQAEDASRRAQRVLTGWTAVLVERLT
jgi:hypothetical protein